MLNVFKKFKFYIIYNILFIVHILIYLYSNVKVDK